MPCSPLYRICSRNNLRLFALTTSVALGACTQQPVRPTPTPAAPQVIRANTGVAECDHYLAHYLACHQSAHIYPQDQIQAHFAAMSQSLTQSANDTQQKAFMTYRCAMLERDLQASLHGQPCTPASSGAAQSPAQQ